jgi:hypothetical protein
VGGIHPLHRSHRRVNISEHNRIDRVQGSEKAAEGVLSDVAMISDTGRDEWVGEL